MCIEFVFLICLWQKIVYISPTICTFLRVSLTHETEVSIFFFFFLKVPVIASRGQSGGGSSGRSINDWTMRARQGAGAKLICQQPGVAEPLVESFQKQGPATVKKMRIMFCKLKICVTQTQLTLQLLHCDVGLNMNNVLTFAFLVSSARRSLGWWISGM